MKKAKKLFLHEVLSKSMIELAVTRNVLLKINHILDACIYMYDQTGRKHWMKSWIWLYLARRQMLDKSDITFVGRQKRLKLRQICHHICPRQMYNKCIINTTPHLLKDKYRVKLNKFEAENSDVLIAIYLSPHWLLSVFSQVNVWVWGFRAELLCNFNREKK